MPLVSLTKRYSVVYPVVYADIMVIHKHIRKVLPLLTGGMQPHTFFVDNY